MGSVRHLPVAPRAPEFLLKEQDNGDAQGDGDERLLQVGDIAKASGKTVRAIHHYEEVGLLRPHARSKGRYRLYDQAALERVRWIGKLHDLGLSLSQIQEMVQLFEKAPSAPGAMSQIRAIYVQKLEETREQIKRLAQLERELAASIDYLDMCDTCDPAALVRACSCCNHHDRSQPEPHLVAGIHAVSMGPQAAPNPGPAEPALSARASEDSLG
jgi:DNA-binding transcriptional MerR regulator